MPDLAEFLARRAAQPAFSPRPTCPRCRKAVVTCYCHQLRPFAAPVSLVILQHAEEARNAIATARMAHLSITNSQLIVGREFASSSLVNRLIADDSQRNLMLYPSQDAVPIEEVLEPGDPTSVDERPLVFWILDAKWSQVPKMLRLSPNVRAIPKVKLQPERESSFQIRRQPRPAYVSTVEAIFHVIDQVRRSRGDEGTEHHALLDVFQYLVRQQQGFVGAETDWRHHRAKELRRRRRVAKGQTGELPPRR